VVRVAVLVVFSVFLGLIIEDLGARLGLLMEKIFLSREDRNNWRPYLSLSFEVEPVGQYYARAISARMRFELNASVAFLIVLPALWLALLSYHSGVTLMIVGYVFVTLCMVYLLFEAISSAKALASIRGLLIEAKAEKPVVQEVMAANSRTANEATVAVAAKKVKAVPLAPKTVKTTAPAKKKAKTNVPPKKRPKAPTAQI
jgi:hypothetical protein